MKKEEDESRKLNEDELVENLVSDPSQIPELRTLTGFLGRSTQDDHWRLYLGPDLGEYLEFRKEDVVHYERLTQEQSPPLGSTIVWVKRDCKLQHMRTIASQEQAAFLQGGIAQRFMAETTPGGIPGVRPGEQAQFPFPRVTILCWPTWQYSVCWCSWFWC